MTKILFFRIGAIGDVILTTAAVKKTRELFPDAVIHYLAGRAAAPVLLNNPHVDKVFVLPEENSRAPKFLRPLLMKKFFKQNFRSTAYDYFIDFESSYYSAYFSFMIKAKTKIGHRIKDKRRQLYNKLYNIRVNYTDGDWYVIKRHMALIKPLGSFDQTDNRTYLNLTQDEKEYGKKYLEANNIGQKDKKIMLCVASKWEIKRWPDGHWKNLVKLIRKNYPEAKMIILKSPDDRPELLKELEELGNVCVIPGEGLRALAAILSYGDFLISNDGAVRHMAVALGVKTIGIFGPSNEKGWAFADENNIVLAPSIDCRPCHEPECEKGGCMQYITPDMVFEKVKAWMK